MKQDYCTNTKFEVEDLKEFTASEALYAFCGFLTSKKDVTKINFKHNVMIDLINEFCEKYNLSEPRKHIIFRFSPNLKK